ncbi:uncharacterized protein LOC103700228 isoform X2 [Phoenix dactylifera]|uniref:Uncharacterized protein LOC103700228 isoform X2 n=1 Tax=Phoenix dactylifera TaxID=42345 RepID=A0A8B9A892_PHODC|nr:uncharacterized protein LOC103700228 isoform X2 [Phoenix dactylifera]
MSCGRRGTSLSTLTSIGTPGRPSGRTSEATEPLSYDASIELTLTLTGILGKAKWKEKPEFNGSENLEFPEFYKKMHTKKNKKWIDPICTVKHSKMLSLREESSQSGVQLTSEEMSRQALGKRKRYILGFGDGPKPSSSSSTSSRVS